MSNFAFNNPAFQQQDPRNVATYPGGPQAAQGQYAPPPASGAAAASFQHGAMDAAANAQLEGMYSAPPAGALETDRMSVEDTVWKTAGLFGILLVTAVVGWIWTATSFYNTGQPNMVPWMVGALGGFVLAMVVIGGSGTLVGPLIGALLVYLSSEWLRDFGGIQLIVFAALVILFARFLPEGLWGLAKRAIRQRGSAAPAANYCRPIESCPDSTRRRCNIARLWRKTSRGRGSTRARCGRGCWTACNCAPSVARCRRFGRRVDPVVRPA